MLNIKNIKLLFLFIGLISQSSLIAQQAPTIVAGINVNRLPRLEKYVQTQMANGNIPGAVTMIIHNGKVVHLAANGYKKAKRIDQF